MRNPIVEEKEAIQRKLLNQADSIEAYLRNAHTRSKEIELELGIHFNRSSGSVSSIAVVAQQES